MSLKFTNLREALGPLREMSKQFICPRDQFFGPLADALERLLELDAEQDLDVDAMCVDIDFYRLTLMQIANKRNDFEGPSLDYMQGYRDGQEYLAKIAREALKPPCPSSNVQSATDQ